MKLALFMININHLILNKVMRMNDLTDANGFLTTLYEYQLELRVIFDFKEGTLINLFLV